MMKTKTAKGFSLIELMIVIAIGAIFAMIALPSYQKQIQKTRRTDAKTELTRFAALEEQYFSRNNQYTNDLNLLLNVAAGTYGNYLTPNGGYYQITLATSIATGAVNATGYKLTAQAQGSQVNDTSCATFTLDNFGVKQSLNNAAAVTTGCW